MLAHSSYWQEPSAPHHPDPKWVIQEKGARRKPQGLLWPIIGSHTPPPLLCSFLQREALRPSVLNGPGRLRLYFLRGGMSKHVRTYCQPPQVLGQGDKPHGWCRQRGWITMTFVCRGDLWRVGGRDVRASGSVLEEAMRPGCHGGGRDAGGSPECSSPGSLVLRNVPGRERSPKAPLWFRKVTCLQALFT